MRRKRWPTRIWPVAPVFFRLMLRSAELMADAATRLDAGHRADGAGVEDGVVRAKKRRCAGSILC